MPPKAFSHPYMILCHTCKMKAPVPIPLSEREGSRVGIRLFGERRVFHRPHPSPATDKGCVESIRKWFEQNGVTP